MVRRNSSVPNGMTFPVGRLATSRVSTATTICPTISGLTGTGGPNILCVKYPLSASNESRIVSASSRRNDIRPNRRLSGSIASSSFRRVDTCRYVADVTTLRWNRLRLHPPCMKSAASQSSNSGCEGCSPCKPKSSGVATKPWPKW